MQTTTKLVGFRLTDDGVVGLLPVLTSPPGIGRRHGAEIKVVLSASPPP